MKSVKIFLIATASLSLQGCWAVFIPGSVISAVADSVTGAEGTHCVAANAQVGGKIKLSDGSLWTVKSLSGTSTRCTNSDLPIRAMLIPVTDAAIRPTSTPSVSKLSLTLGAGWEKRPFTDQMSSSDTVLYATNRTTDIGMLLTAVKREGITDLMAFANARMANQVNRLTDPKQSEISQIEINGKKVLRFTVAGALKSGMKITYLLTVIEGESEIAILNGWTSTANFENQRSAIELLAMNVTGL
jgi:hypothetical protein